MTTDNIAFAAAIISAISMLISWRGFSYAKKSYQIAKTDHDKKFSEIIPYLIEAVDWKRNGEQFSSFAISYTNHATEANSIPSIELELECYDKNGIFNKIKLRPEVDINPVGLTHNHEKLPVPLNLEPKSTSSGWLTFKIPLTPKNGLRVDTYRITGTTSDNNKISVESFIHRMVVDEE